MILVKVPWLPSVYRGRTTWAITIAPFVFILPKFADNKAILAHEQVHLDQVKRMSWINFYWNYLFNIGFRRSVEAEGYAKQREVEKWTATRS